MRRRAIASMMMSAYSHHPPHLHQSNLTAEVLLLSPLPASPTRTTSPAIPRTSLHQRHPASAMMTSSSSSSNSSSSAAAAAAAMVLVDGASAIASMMMSAYSHHPPHLHQSNLTAEVLLLSPLPASPTRTTSPAIPRTSLHQRHPASAMMTSSSSSSNSSSSAAAAAAAMVLVDGASNGSDRRRYVPVEPCYSRLAVRQPHTISGACPSSSMTPSRLSTEDALDSSSSSPRARVVPRDKGGTPVYLEHREDIGRNLRRSTTGARIKLVATAGLLQQPPARVVSDGSASTSTTTTAALVVNSDGSKRFRCEYCSFYCSWRYDLKLHLKQKHGILKKIV
uniref:Uncharacterized protein n=1 Tax=Anopheles atroparvus TaxID=41427 RepID=A0A182J7A8_ANOAO